VFLALHVGRLRCCPPGVKEARENGRGGRRLLSSVLTSIASRAVLRGFRTCMHAGHVARSVHELHEHQCSRHRRSLLVSTTSRVPADATPLTRRGQRLRPHRGTDSPLSTCMARACMQSCKRSCADLRTGDRSSCARTCSCRFSDRRQSVTHARTCM
jgi:hypothetical protein